MIMIIINNDINDNEILLLILMIMIINSNDINMININDE